MAPKVTKEGGVSIKPFSNADKEKVPHETWADKKKRAEKKGREFGAKDRANFPCPSRLGLFGPPGVGKTTCIANILDAADPPYDELYVIHGDAAHSEEYDALKPAAVLGDVPGVDFWRSLPQNEKKPIRRIIVVDDLEVTKCPRQRLENLGILFRYVSTHLGITTCWVYQSLFDTPAIIRKMLSVFVLWRPHSRQEITTAENRVGLEAGTLTELFRELCPGHRDSICIDLSPDSPAKLRLNLFRKIDGVQDFD
jgi:hypothetical protein